ncbi:Uncharacterised protein [Yersinia intermedia]|nr:Uncharacterised protein [Yersinia intermedia]
MRIIAVIIMASTIVLTSGCATAMPSVSTSPTGVVSPIVKTDSNIKSSVPVNDMEQSRKFLLQQCRQQLNAIQTYNEYIYNHYQADFMKIEKQTDNYLKIKEIINDDTRDVVTPNYEFHIRSICFKIKNSLTQLMIDSINEPKTKTIVMKKPLHHVKNNCLITASHNNEKMHKTCSK